MEIVRIFQGEKKEKEKKNCSGFGVEGGGDEGDGRDDEEEEEWRGGVGGVDMSSGLKKVSGQLVTQLTLLMSSSSSRALYTLFLTVLVIIIACGASAFPIRGGDHRSGLVTLSEGGDDSWDFLLLVERFSPLPSPPLRFIQYEGSFMCVCVCDRERGRASAFATLVIT